MKKLIFVFTCLLSMQLQSHITIRLAVQDDLPALMDLDLRVSLDDYIAVVPQYYPEYFTAQKYADMVIAEVNKEDYEIFQKGIEQKDLHRVHVAIDQASNTLIGYATYFKQGKTLKFNFIAIDKNWRHQGIGSKLVQAAIGEFNDATSCWAGPLQCQQSACCFLESIGFVNKGPGADVMNIFGFSTAKWSFVYERML